MSTTTTNNEEAAIDCIEQGLEKEQERKTKAPRRKNDRNKDKKEIKNLRMP